MSTVWIAPAGRSDRRRPGRRAAGPLHRPARSGGRPARRPGCRPGTGRCGSPAAVRPRRPSSPTRSTSWPARCRSARGGSASSCCPSRTSCGRRWPHCAATAEALADGVVGPDGAEKGRRDHAGRGRAPGTGSSPICSCCPGSRRPTCRSTSSRSIWSSWSPRPGRRGPPAAVPTVPVLRVELPDHPVVVNTDPGRIRQVIDGLCENALRVVPAGQPLILAVRHAAIEIRDGGPRLHRRRPRRGGSTGAPSITAIEASARWAAASGWPWPLVW